MVNEITNLDNYSDMLYRVLNEVGSDVHSIITTVIPDWPKVFVKYNRTRNNKLSLMEPLNSPHDTPWFMEVSNEKLIRNINDTDYIYQPLERNAQNMITGQYQIVKVKESITKVDSNVLKTQYNNLQVTTDSSSNIQNITILNNDIDISNIIKSVDSKRGIINLNRDINVDQSNSFIEYYRYINNVQYKNINVNPYMLYNLSNSTILDKYVLIFMMPNESYSYLSSRLIKEAARLGADVSAFVPASVKVKLEEKLSNG